MALRHLSEEMPGGLSAQGDTPQFYGVYPAVVVVNMDPASQGRVKVRLPWVSGGAANHLECWARMTTFMAGNNRGSWFIPDIDDEVLVAFEGGDPGRPYVIGALWNGTDSPPEAMSQGNYLKVLQSRNGLRIEMDDTDGVERLKLETPGGQVLTLKDGPGAIEITDSNGNKVNINSSGVIVETSSKVTIRASTIELESSQLTVSAGQSKFAGTVSADKIITNSVESQLYTPGVGNVW